jgi:hypothetical protein
VLLAPVLALTITLARPMPAPTQVAHDASRERAHQSLDVGVLDRRRGVKDRRASGGFQPRAGSRGIPAVQ